MKLISLGTLLSLAALFASTLLVRAADFDSAGLARAVADAATYESGADATPLRQIESYVRQAVATPAKRQEVEAALLKLLDPTSAFEARRFACQQLAIIGTEASLPSLAKLLKSDETAGLACLALANQSSAKAGEVLRDALAAAPALARVQIINTLGDRADAEAVKPLASAARDTDAKVADAAIASLGKIATPPALEALAALRKDNNPVTVQLAVQATLAAADKIAVKETKTALAMYEELLGATHPANIRRAALAGLLRVDKSAAEQRIPAVLHGNDPALKPVAIAAIPGLKSRNASATFAKEMPNLQPAEQVLLIQALAARGDAAARAAINDNLVASDDAVRRAAITALGQLGDASSVAALANALAKARSTEDRHIAEQALASLGGGVKTDQALVAQLKNSPSETKATLIPILARRNSRSAVPALLEETADPATASAAFQALAKLGTAEDLPALVDQLAHLKIAAARNDAENAVAQALAKTSDTARRSDVVGNALSNAADVEARLSLIGLLPACGGTRALEALKNARTDQEPRVREAATRALAEWPDLTAWDALAEIYRQPDSEPIRAVALRGLVRLAGDANAKPDAVLIARYRTLLAGAKSDDERKLILGALGGCAHPDALELVQPLADNSGLKAEAILAAKKISDALKNK